MLPFKLHKSYVYFITLILFQLLLGWFLYSAFNSPNGNVFDYTTIAIYWGTLIVLFSVFIILETHQIIKPWIVPVAILVCYAVFLFALYESSIFHRIPRLNSAYLNYEIIPLYLTIPAMFHAIIDIIFKYFKPSGTKAENIQNFALSVVIPLFLYILIIVIIPIFNRGYIGYFRLDFFIAKIVICIAIASFLFFFFRFILGCLVKKNFQQHSPLLLILFAFIFPFVGLLLSLEFNFFGDFNFPLIHASITINALGLGLLLSKNVLLKLIGFLMASIGVPIVLYFFIVFLPYVPLAFVALLIVGAGLLMLTPTVLIILQYKIMRQEFPAIVQKYGRKKVIIWSSICISFLPLSFVGFCMDHRSYLNEVIAETDQFDASNRSYKDHDVEKLTYILKQMKTKTYRRSFGFSHDQLPILSAFYDWYVFDNLKISRQKTDEIRTLFFGKNIASWNRYIPPQKANSNVTYTYETTYVPEDDFYKTEIHLSITNLEDRNMREFRSEFRLPKDVFITDYYLDIEDRRTYGILAEKKAANWIYEQITTRRRDPGILQYLYDDVLSLKIFPFAANETRTSGFTLYHRTPVHFSLNETPIDIDVEPLTQHVIELSENSFYIPSEIKSELPKVSSPVDYYFVVDNTTKGAEFRQQFHQDFKSLPATIQEKVNVLYVDVDVNWEAPTPPKTSGFNYKKALKQIQYLHRDQKRIPYVIVYAPYENRYTGKYFSWEMEKAFPYYNLVECSHWKRELPETIELLEFSRNEQSYFIRNNNKPSLISLNETATFERDFSGNPYLNALQLRLFHDLNDLNPKHTKNHWLAALRESFTQNILTHSTTFISLENKEQEERLLKKQEAIINKDYSKNVAAETRRMSEPYFWVLLLFITFILGRQFYNSKHHLKV
ncbi:MSEP-CTERM sorting domain-containing protein [uncultured Kordia sp.]|uniref:MSEP-CTERM sorting domain-containing protein n=1 Tax=uncultured Kordia sp. TaxID=507699 RepID=UPI0026050A63|nr:MSEP-CTERM sorting domain-containing protein [uncultured Kordia sp.]